MPTNLDLNTPVTVSYSGATVDYVATSDGLFTFEAWGGGGGGGSYRGSNSFNGTGGGGPGGNSTGAFAVSSGDTITVQVGQGGRGAVADTRGGAGGYPDGGSGGLGLTGTGGVSNGGGGGSTRIYKNGTLMVIVGGGGGALQQRWGGSGGGLTGNAGAPVSGQSNTGTPGQGGTQSAGGNGYTAFQNGGSLAGGVGYPSGGSATTASANSGGGGGGGYYGGGGGGGVSPSQYGTGGGGSSHFYTGADGNSYTGPASSTTPHDSGHKPSGVAQGGTNISSAAVGASAGNGGDGAVYMTLSDSQPPTSATSYGYTGVKQFFNVPATGKFYIKAWGGGGGGGVYTNSASNGNGGGAGCVGMTITVAAGDLIAFEVAQGGGGAKSTGGGDAAYPDGGYGGTSGSTGTTNHHGGGGGGSTRVYWNGTLVGVAAGGGGGVGTAGGSTAVLGGSGGGSTGGGGFWNGTQRAGGGTQSAGGSNTSSPGQSGGSLRGGNGSNTAQATATAYAGGGGGGGYYGGAGGGYYGGGGTQDRCGGGGAGSSYILSNASITDTLNASNASNGLAAAANNTDTWYALTSSAGQGGDASTSSGVGASNGNNGAFVVQYSSGVPANVSGNIGTINMTTPSGVGGGGLNTSGSIGEIDLTTPSGSAGVATTQPGSIGTITMATLAAGAGIRVDLNLTFPGPITNNGSELGGQGFADAFINIPVSNNDIVMTSPASTASVPVSLSKAFPGPIVLTAPKATIPGQTSGDIGTIVLTALDGAFSEIIEATGDIGAILLSAPDATLSLGAGVSGDIGTISITAPDATADTFVTGTGTLGTITLTTPTGSGGNGALTFPGPIDLTAPDGTPDIGPFEGELATITLTPPVGEFTYQASGDIGTIDLTSPTGAFSDGSAHPSGDIGTISVSALDGEFNYIGYSTPFEHDITFSAPSGSGSGQASATGSVGSTILVTTPAGGATGEVWNYITTPAVVHMVPPTAQNVHGAIVLASIIPALVTMKVVNATAGPANSGAGNADFGDLVISLESPEGYVYVDSPGWARIRLKRSATANVVPGSLAPREIAINEAEGILFTRDGSGNVQPTPLASIQAGAFVPPDAPSGNYLRGDNSWGYAAPTYDKPVRLSLPEGSIVLTEGATLGTTTLSLTPDTIYYRPFFVPKTITLTSLSINIATPANATAHVGVCKWILPQAPDITVLEGALSTSVGGSNSLTASVTLTPGWYAAMIAVSGSGTPVLSGYNAPQRLASDFSVSGDPTGVFTGNFTSLGSPTGRATDCIAFLTATSINE